VVGISVFFPWTSHRQHFSCWHAHAIDIVHTTCHRPTMPTQGAWVDGNQNFLARFARISYRKSLSKISKNREPFSNFSKMLKITYHRPMHRRIFPWQVTMPTALPTCHGPAMPCNLKNSGRWVHGKKKTLDPTLSLIFIQ